MINKMICPLQIRPGEMTKVRQEPSGREHTFPELSYCSDKGVTSTWMAPKAVGANAVQDLCRAALPPTGGWQHSPSKDACSEVKDRESQGDLTPEQIASIL